MISHAEAYVRQMERGIHTQHVKVTSEKLEMVVMDAQVLLVVQEIGKKRDNPMEVVMEVTGKSKEMAGIVEVKEMEQVEGPPVMEEAVEVKIMEEIGEIKPQKRYSCLEFTYIMLEC